MNLLIHACCAPCLTYTHHYFKNNHSGNLSVLWFNPNIHPFKEYEKRLKSLIDYQEKTGVDIIYEDKYDLKIFLKGALETKSRCEFCYRYRLAETAKITKKKDFDAYTTTLTISPYQDHNLIKEIGEEEARKNGIKFIYRDLTDGFYKSHEMANDMNLYKQGYCGCIFSEMDRYEKKII
ncbi:MAG: epoxyqueuosine reductase QueH [Candidatus Saliniplasma sp.]